MITDATGLKTPETDISTADQAGCVLRVDGLVIRPCQFTVTDLADLPRATFTETFSCDDQWATQSQRWRGPRLLDVLELAGILPAAKYVRVGAGEYVVPVLLAEADGALLADMLNDQPLPPEHGAPWRLALPGKQCFTSVKWVDRLEMTAERGLNVGARLTSERLRVERA